ncbi:MAG: hypothetical protein V2A61_05830 [Calditrichota bacterium]
MKRFGAGILLILFAAGCGGWGDYVYKSDRFKFKLTFPDKWEVMDRSDDKRDFLIAALPDIPDARIIVTALPVAPDISPNEIYPSFMEGKGDAAILMEFKITEKSTISAKNAEGRLIKVQWLGENTTMQGLRTIFLGNRFILEISAEMPQEQFLNHEIDLKKMIRLLEL